MQTSIVAPAAVLGHPKTMATGVADHESYLLCPGRQPVQIPPNHNVSRRRLLRLVIDVSGFDDEGRGISVTTVGGAVEKEEEWKDKSLSSTKELNRNSVIIGRHNKNNYKTITTGRQRRDQQHERRYYHHNNNSHRPPPTTATKHIIDIYHWICH